MKDRLCLLLLTYSILFSACGEKQCLVKTTTTKQGSEIETIKNICKDNKIVSEQQVSRTTDNKLVANGYFKEYFDNGSVNSIAFFKDNKQDSIAIRYYENGNKELEFYWDNGNKVGFQSIYYQNGRLKKREYFLKDSTKMFIVTYNEKGNIEKLDGTLFYITYDKDVNNLKSGELFIANEIVQLDNLESNFSIKFYSPSKRKIIDTVMTTFMKYGNKYFFPRLFNLSERGAYSYNVHLKLIDKFDSKILKEDSTTFTITVNK